MYLIMNLGLFFQTRYIPKSQIFSSNKVGIKKKEKLQITSNNKNTKTKQKTNKQKTKKQKKNPTFDKKIKLSITLH